MGSVGINAPGLLLIVSVFWQTIYLSSAQNSTPFLKSSQRSVYGPNRQAKRCQFDTFGPLLLIYDEELGGYSRRVDKTNKPGS